MMMMIVIIKRFAKFLGKSLTVFRKEQKGKKEAAAEKRRKAESNEDSAPDSKRQKTEESEDKETENIVNVEEGDGDEREKEDE